MKSLSVWSLSLLVSACHLTSGSETTGKHNIQTSVTSQTSLIGPGLTVKASVVDSVVTQLQGGLYGKCLRTIVSVSDYTVEVRTQSITEQIFHCNCSILGRTEENDNQIQLRAAAP